MNKMQVWQMKQLKESTLTYGDVAIVFGVSKQEVTKALGGVELRKLIARANGKCELCGEISKRLNVHHVSYIRRKVKVICCSCHRSIHAHTEFKTTREWMNYMTDLARTECGTVIGSLEDRFERTIPWAARPRR